MKKIYFIKPVSGESPWIEVLKNHFKTLDAIRDLLEWHAQGHAVACALEEHEPGKEDPMYFSTTIGGPDLLGRAPQDGVLRLLRTVMHWLDSNKVFDIVIERQEREFMPRFSLN